MTSEETVMDQASSISTDEFAFSEMQVEAADREVCCPLRTYEHLTHSKVSKFRDVIEAYDEWLLRNLPDDAEIVKEGDMSGLLENNPVGIVDEEQAKKAWLDAMKKCKAMGKDDQYRTARKIADEFGWLDE